MPATLTPEKRRAVAERVRFYHELGIYDFYRRVPPAEAIQTTRLESPDLMPVKRNPATAIPEDLLAPTIRHPEYNAADPAQALRMIREDLGDCTRCRLHQQGRKQIVFGVGNPRADLMFVGEGPGADEDEKGEPFVGRAGQLLNNMIKAMGLSREEVYIANIVKCRPPGNRTPERDECDTCSPFLMRQIATIKPKVIVALGATAAKTLLGMTSSLGDLRGRFYDFKPVGAHSNDPAWASARLAVTYHPAYLLRDPRQKGEAWKDLQMVMKELGLSAPPKTAD
jgi:uracil-DNA glycosylase